MDFLTLAKDRYSARKFVSGEVPQEDIDKIIEAGLCAPTRDICYRIKSGYCMGAPLRSEELCRHRRGDRDDTDDARHS